MLKLPKENEEIYIVISEKLVVVSNCSTRRDESNASVTLPG